ncbi:MAG: SDR family NAD(P)-dependent oxidoreductase [Pleomorphochaeta sp.]
MNSRKLRIAILMSLDIICFVAALILSMFIVHGFKTPFSINTLMIFLVQVISFFIFKVYRVRLLDSSLELAVRGASTILASIIGFLIVYQIDIFNITTFRVLISYSFLSYFFTMGYRVLYRFMMNTHDRRNYGGNTATTDCRKTALVYGAGEIGKALARQSTKGKLDYNIIGFIDDDKIKKGTLILNRQVFGNVKDLENVLVSTKVKTLIIAVTELSAEKMQEAVSSANSINVEVKIVPSLFELENSNKQPIDLRSIDYKDLLGRKLIEIDKEPIREMIEGKVVLVTGACGSIGSEISRQARSYNPKKLILLDIDESSLHDSALRLLNYKAEWSDEVVPVLCDIKNKEKIDQIIEQYKPDIIFHAAAYKHVPLIQLYPEEGIRTNVGGSFNVLSSAAKHKVKKVVVISTDKAVNPTNVMGATKRMVELEAAMLNEENPDTEYVCVRFGNVLGSRGSMLPLFIEEIQAGVPITVTDKKIIRYFMAIPEAVSLVFLAGSIGKGGEVMVLDMGQPINIYEFAKKLINMYGDPNKNKITITGLRPGEKMYEELLANKDNTIPTSNKLIFKAKVTGSLNKEEFKQTLPNINKLPPETLKRWVKDTVVEFDEKK